MKKRQILTFVVVSLTLTFTQGCVTIPWGLKDDRIKINDRSHHYRGA